MRGNSTIIVTTIILYCLIAVEIIIMISPFALYFYSVYGPILNFLSAIPPLRWTSEFFLPHMVFLDDPLVLGISYLQILFIIGLILFLCAAIPLYYGRFTGKGVVATGLYSKIRHPQYLFLAISGFGLLLYWPRFIILILYVSMLFVYYLLALNEEWRMKREEPHLYEYYMHGTGMFLPGGPGGKIYDIFFGRLPKWLGITILYLLTLACAVMLAMALRTHVVSKLPVTKKTDITLLPVFPRPQQEVNDIYQALRTYPATRSLLQELRPNLVYVFPGDYFLTALVTDEDRRFSENIIERFPEVLEWHQNKFRGGLGKFFKIFYNYFRTLGTVETNQAIERIVLVRVADPAGALASDQDLFKMGMERKPLLIVDLDAHDYEALTIKAASGDHKWGSMNMPTF